jgi:hypothetical protein
MDLDLMITQMKIYLGEDFSMWGNGYLFLIVMALKGQ